MNGCNKIEISIILNAMAGNDIRVTKAMGSRGFGIKMRSVMETDYVNNRIVITGTLFSIHVQIDLGTCYLKSENQFNPFKLAVKICS